MVTKNVANSALEGSMDALWMKMQEHLDNLANYETPDYKAKTVSFGEVLDAATQEGERKSSAHLRLTMGEDNTTMSRVDGNNVDMEKEQLELWKTQAQYAAVAQKISGSYNNLRTILNQVGR